MIETFKNTLFVGAHPDDLEVMAGGTAKRIIDLGGRVHCLTLTDGSWESPNGETFRDNGAAVHESIEASKILGYTLEHLDEKIFDIHC